MRRLTVFAVLAAAASTGVPAAELSIQQDVSRRSVEYVRSLDLDCTLADGYVCADIEEDDFMTPASWHRMVPAVYMPAWQAAYGDFRGIADLSPEQKDLKHYKLGFTENADHYIVVLLGLTLPYVDPQGQASGVTSAVFGRSVKYWIDKRSNRVARRVFFK